MVKQPSTIIVMGVCGCGKTTLGILLAAKLGWLFFDGDDFHPENNIRKMSAGIPLDDEDRSGWLDCLRNLITEHIDQRIPLVVAASALRETYRSHLIDGNPNTIFVYLKGSQDLILERMKSRKGHYMKAGMVESQFAILEEPVGAIVVDIAQPPESIVMEILRKLKDWVKVLD